MPLIAPLGAFLDIYTAQVFSFALQTRQVRKDRFT